MMKCAMMTTAALLQSHSPAMVTEDSRVIVIRVKMPRLFMHMIPFSKTLSSREYGFSQNAFVFPLSFDFRSVEIPVCHFQIWFYCRHDYVVVTPPVASNPVTV